jgi:hypothetical protein
LHPRSYGRRTGIAGEPVLQAGRLTQLGLDAQQMLGQPCLDIFQIRNRGIALRDVMFELADEGLFNRRRHLTLLFVIGSQKPVVLRDEPAGSCGPQRCPVRERQGAVAAALFGRAGKSGSRLSVGA